MKIKHYFSILPENEFQMKGFFTLLIATWFIPVFISAQPVTTKKQFIPDSLAKVKNLELFSDDTPLIITLKSDFKKIVKEKTRNERISQPAVLFHHKEDSFTDSLNIKIKSRGYARRVFPYCYFPPIMLNFDKDSLRNTIFEGQNKLKMVTYCKNTDENQAWVLEEYLIYQLYNLLTDYSYRVRLMKVTYQDIDPKSKPITRYGFFLESPEHMAARNNSLVSKALLASHDRCNREAINRFTVFQFMIGNTDWWTAKPLMHNVTLVQPEQSMPIPVPYDFDYSGVINTSYATPHKDLPLTSVTERYFRGYCRPLGEYEKTLELFNNRKDDIYQLYRDFPLIDKNTSKKALSYYDEFYRIINDPGEIRRKFYDACELQHQHVHQIPK